MSKKDAAQEEGTRQERKTLMYCGPAIPGIAQHGMLFSQPPPLLVKFSEACPAVKSFLVEPKEYMSIKQQAACKGSLLYTQYHAVLEHLQRR